MLSYLEVKYSRTQFLVSASISSAVIESGNSRRTVGRVSSARKVLMSFAREEKNSPKDIIESFRNLLPEKAYIRSYRYLK